MNIDKNQDPIPLNPPGRRPELSDDDVFRACSQLFDSGVEAKRITGYKLRVHFGKGNLSRYDRLAKQWRADNRFEESKLSSESAPVTQLDADNPMSALISGIDLLKTRVEETGKEITAKEQEKLNQLKSSHNSEIQSVVVDAEEKDRDAIGLISQLEAEKEALEKKLSERDQVILEHKEQMAKLMTAVENESNQRQQLETLLQKSQAELQELGALRSQFSDSKTRLEEMTSELRELKGELKESNEKQTKMFQEFTEQTGKYLKLLEQKDEQLEVLRSKKLSGTEVKKAKP